MQERRCSGRWQIDSQASLKIPGHNHPFYCTVDDINFKGLRIRFPRYVEMNSHLKLDISLSNELSLKIEVAPAWNKAIGSDNVYGFFFTRIKDGDKENIYKFIQRNFADKISQQFYRNTF
jgi:hypothetical protein